MCIEKSVGEGGVNTREDGVVIQILLNYNRPPPLPPLGVDGGVGKMTKDAIREFQTRVMKMPAPDGKVDPGGATIATLRKGIPAGPIDATILRGIMPSASASKVQTYLQPILNGMAGRAINTSLRQAHFLAQTGHESGGLVYSEEIASGEAYNGRADLGNTEPGDGPKFKGRGLIQLTGRANYTAYGTAIGRDLLTIPGVVSTDPFLAVDAACWFWETHNLNTWADADDIKTITRRINGGLRGLADREAYLKRAKFFLGL